MRNKMPILKTKKNLILNYSDSNEKEKIQTELESLNEKEKTLRKEAQELISKADKNVETNDKDYVFIHFILNYLPKGVIGLLLAMALCAAMSSTASELNALATTTTMDLYKRNQKSEKTESHYLKASKWFTFLWGILAILFACVANLFDNLIQLVNIIGSIFYGNVLGIFLLAFFFKTVKSKAVFTAAIFYANCCNLRLVVRLDAVFMAEFLWLCFGDCYGFNHSTISTEKW
jgi:Na+/proline symporter